MHPVARRSAVLAVAFSLALSACESGPSSPTRPATGAGARAGEVADEPEISEERVREIWASDEVQQVLTLQSEFVRRVDAAVERGVAVDEIRAAATAAVGEGNDDAALAELLFESREEADEYVATLQEARFAVTAAFPEVAAAEEDLEPSACALGTGAVDTFFDRFEASRSAQLDPTIDGAAGRTSVPTCGSYWKQIKLLGCAGLCSASTAGLGTVLCGWGCWCMLCSTNSAVGEAMC